MQRGCLWGGESVSTPPGEGWTLLAIGLNLHSEALAEGSYNPAVLPAAHLLLRFHWDNRPPLKSLLGTSVLSFPWWENYSNWTEQPPSILASTNEWVMMDEKENHKCLGRRRGQTIFAWNRLMRSPPIHVATLFSNRVAGPGRAEGWGRLRAGQCPTLAPCTQEKLRQE